MSKRKLRTSKKSEKRTFEDISGNNTIFISHVLSIPEEEVSEFAIVVTDFMNEELSVTLLSKSDIPRLIRELSKFI